MSGEEDGNNSSGSSSSSGHPWIKQFEKFCSSDDLSLDGILQRITDGRSNGVSLAISLCDSSLLHRVCMNENVTLEIVEYLVDLYPRTIHRCAIHSCLDIPDEYIESAYPLHLACYNKECPNEVIQLLLRKDQERYQLHNMCRMDFDYGNTGIILDEDDDYYGGTPLHLYLSRTSNVNLNVVKQLVANAEILLSSDTGLRCTPIHIVMHNESIGMFDVVNYLANKNPSSLLEKDIYDQTPLHVACGNRYMTAKTIEILLQACPDSIHQRNCNYALPIHTICEVNTDDEVARDILKLLLEAHPDSVSETDDEGSLPIYKAVDNKSPAFCKLLLVDDYPESVRRQNDYGWLPFHVACQYGRFETVEYLFGLYPESLHIRTNIGRLPIHCAANSTGKNAYQVLTSSRS